MYELREVIIKKGTIERSVWVIDFDDPSLEIIGEFLMTDAKLMNYRVLEDIEDVLSGEKSDVKLSGNRCALVITAEDTFIEDLFVGLFDDFDTYESCKINTKELRDLIIMWRDETTGDEE